MHVEEACEWWQVDELVLVVLSYLNVKDLQRAALVCSVFRDSALKMNWMLLYFNLYPILYNTQHDLQRRNTVGNRCENDYMLSKNPNHVPTHIKLKSKRKKQLVLLNAGVDPNLIPIPNNPKDTLVFMFHAKKKWSNRGLKQFETVQKAEKFLHKNIVPGKVQTDIKKYSNVRFKQVDTSYNTMVLMGETYLHVIDMATTEHVVPPFRALLQRTIAGEYLTHVQIEFNAQVTIEKKQELQFEHHERLCIYDVFVAGVIEYMTEKWIPFLQCIRVYDVDDYTDSRIPGHGIELAHSYLPHDEFLTEFRRSIIMFHVDINSNIMIASTPKASLLIFKGSTLIGTINRVGHDLPNVFATHVQLIPPSSYMKSSILVTEVTYEAATSLLHYDHCANQVFEISIFHQEEANETYDITCERLRMQISDGQIKMISKIDPVYQIEASRTYGLSRDHSTIVERDSAGTTIIMYDLDANTKAKPVPWIDRDLSHQHFVIRAQNNMSMFTTETELQLMVSNIPRKKREMVRALPLSLFKLNTEQREKYFGNILSLTEVNWGVSKKYHISNSGVIILIWDYRIHPEPKPQPYTSVAYIF